MIEEKREEKSAGYQDEESSKEIRRNDFFLYFSFCNVIRYKAKDNNDDDGLCLKLLFN